VLASAKPLHEKLNCITYYRKKLILYAGATNRPHELDEAARRRLTKRLYIPLPSSGVNLHALQTLSGYFYWTLKTCQIKLRVCSLFGGGGGGGGVWVGLC